MKVDKHVRMFLNRIERVPNGCWVWKNARGRNKYWTVWTGKKYIGAHRFSWLYHCGQIPVGKYVLHKCDNKTCVNPDHLFIGTQLENMTDMRLKGRDHRPGPLDSAKGEQHGMSKLTDKQVLQIRRRYRRISYHRTNVKQLAIEYGVSRNMISRIVSGRNWAHVT